MSSARGAVCPYLVTASMVISFPSLYTSGIEESGPSEAEYREVSAGDHRADQETGPSLPAGVQRPEWNCKFSPIPIPEV